MSQGPLQEREAKKYVSPIPSREFILEHLTKREKPVNHDELATEFNTKGEEQQEAPHRRLRAMERDEQLAFTRRQCYVLSKRPDLLKGTVIGHRGGYGFLHAKGRKDDLYLSSGQTKTYIHGDQVLAQPLGTGRKGRREARIVRVLMSKTSQIIGHYFTDAGVEFIVPGDDHLSFDILILLEEVMGIRMGFVVVVELTQRPTRRAKTVGKIVEVLDDGMGTSIAIDMALRTREVPYVWSQVVEKQVAGLREEVPEETEAGCANLRSLSLATIGGEDARDFDDAVHCEKRRGGSWYLWVTIADVSCYVHPLTPLDWEARNRGTSVYFPSQVVLILPGALSNGLCSFSPRVDRLCMVCETTISSKDRLTGFKSYEAVMNSHARLTHTKVWHMLRGDQELREQYAPLVKHIEELHSLYKVLGKAREERSGISFESEGVKFTLSVERRIERIEQTQRSGAHKLVEEYITMTNISAARLVEKAKEPTLFRTHDKLTVETINSFRSVLPELGLELSDGNKPELRNHARLPESVADHPDTEVLQTMLLRPMKQTIYDLGNRGHSGLALQPYVHFTSPIRRYPDPFSHRAIKCLLAQEQGHKDNTAETGGYRYSIEEMLQLDQHYSMTERRADEAARDVSDQLKCDFMLDQVDNVLEGVAASVAGFGSFVRLDELFIDDLVHISSLDNGHYRLDQVGQRLTGESSDRMYHLGDHVEIRVETVSMDERGIDFSLISSERVPCNEGKTAREKAGKGNVDKSTDRRRQMGRKADFGPDSALHGEKKGRAKPQADKNVAEKKDDEEAKKPPAKTLKIAATAKARRTMKEKVA